LHPFTFEGATMPGDETLARNPAATTFPDPFPNEYRVTGVLGEGAFGKVWLAEQLNVGRRLVAVKTLKIPVHSPTARRSSPPSRRTLSPWRR